MQSCEFQTLNYWTPQGELLNIVLYGKGGISKTAASRNKSFDPE